MILMRILPGVLKELATHIPTVMFQVVDWREIASEVPRLSKRILQKEGYTDLLRSQSEIVTSLGIELSEQEVAGISMADAQVCRKLLHLYFAQLFSKSGVFLDLRAQHFENRQGILRWHPTGLWTHFEDSFQEGLLKIYDGFYTENEALYLEGLEQSGLVARDWPEQDQQELARLFKNHFGSSLDGMRFSLDSFKDSLVAISHFMLERKVKITKDFLYLGIYLVTLYSSLEKCQSLIPVKEIYLEARRGSRAEA